MKNKTLFPLERNRYFHGKMLTARDFDTEQNYNNNKRRLINRCILGTGVVCGLGVYLNDETSFSMETGLALDYSGREIAVTSPIIRKLQMVEGFESLAGHEQAYLCLEYAEQMREPVNNIGVADSESQQFNKIEEGYRLSLDTCEPDVETLLGESGKNQVQVLYASRGLAIYQIVPAAVMAGQEFSLRFMVVKGTELPQVSFEYSFQSDYLKSAEGDRIKMVFNEDQNLKRDIHIVEYTLRAASISDMQVPLAKGPAALKVRMGDIIDQIELSQKCAVYICGSLSSYEKLLDIQAGSLDKQMSGEDTPIYLAKIDYVYAGNTYILRKITGLPFGQRVAALPGKSAGNQFFTNPVEDIKKVTTETEILKYWQKPEISAKYNPLKKSIDFHFGIPSSEAYDYATASGIVDVRLSGAIRVNGRYVSDEISHNLGIGDVSLNFAVEFGNSENRKLLFGNGDVFSSKNEGKDIPKVEVAGILYPDSGTFRVGIRCLDHVEGHFLKVRWFAYKVTRDSASMRAKDIVTIKIKPEIHKIKILERIQYEAEVSGTADKRVLWSVQDDEGGKIDQNGLYQAPSTAGTYEIVAASSADAEAKTSAFVIVED
ncbi:hypothetical protein REC12_24460 [Desulfosporosinus sp. PR]|uniref:hypothetical protein n=1 Tax=Candidatus Desulfosporosinus nitrosoreducens TaxID=3401928 RepID=UPI0027F8157C|nr:hypothetical protein [Desulfosporosinus sp. PR]MDQ7096750.1 hypothetical protein [Desulfosporosinus sp. PR]